MQSEERRPEETLERDWFLHIRLRFLLLASIRRRRHAEVVHRPPTHTCASSKQMTRGRGATGHMTGRSATLVFMTDHHTQQMWVMLMQNALSPFKRHTSALVPPPHHMSDCRAAPSHGTGSEGKAARPHPLTNDVKHKVSALT